MLASGKGLTPPMKVKGEKREPGQLDVCFKRRPKTQRAVEEKGTNGKSSKLLSNSLITAANRCSKYNLNLLNI